MVSPRLICLVFAATLGTALGTARAELPALMPLPVQARQTDDVVGLTGRIAVSYPGYRSARLDAALSRLVQRLERRTGIPTSVGEGPDAVRLTIDCADADPAEPGPDLREDYTLDVGRDGVVVKAPGPTGILRGLATLVQLVQSTPSGFALAGAHIEDRPRFPWRGLLIDVARHFVSVAGVERQIDLMETVKLNVLHLHLSDAEGFRLESTALPSLHEVGSFGQYYTQAQMREIIDFAAARGVRVVPEFDMPAHTGSWLLAYPEMAAGEIGDKRTNILADEVMDPSVEALYPQLDVFWGEIAALFPDRYVHIGGDEVNGVQWTGSGRIDAFKAAHNLPDNRAFQAYFTRRVQTMLAARGKIMVGWDEIITDGLPPDVVVESWRSSTMTARAVRQGYRTIVSGGAYLDLLLPAEDLYRIDPADVNAYGLDPAEFAAVREVPGTGWLLDEMRVDASPPLSPAEQALILGGEAPLWSETETEETLDKGLWPRAAAYAERLWTPVGRIDVDSMRRRLPVIDRLLEILGCDQYGERARMLARLAPSDPDALIMLAETAEPAKRYVRWHAISRPGDKPQVFNEFADALFPQSMAALRADLLVTDILEGAPARHVQATGELRPLLAQWQANDARIAALPEAHGARREIVELSRDLAAIAKLGDAALDLLGGEAGPATVDDPGLAAALARQLEGAAASASTFAVVTKTQPPGEVFLAVAAPIARLAKAARETAASGR